MLKTLALEIKSVIKKYPLHRGEIKAVDNLNLELKKGSVFGFLGPNGAGKTTTMKMILGLAYPDSGTITIFGQKAGTTLAAKHIGFMPENPSFYRYLSALELVTMHGQLMGLSKKASSDQAAKLLIRVGLEKSMKQPIREYSKGMIQRAGLAQALIGDPDLLLLDEPFSGLDVLGRYEMKNLILELKKSNTTIFFNSHILSEMEQICDEVGIIDHGELLKHGSIKSLLKPKQTLEEYFVALIEQKRGVDVK